MIVRQAPMDSAIVRAIEPDARWGLPEHLLAAVFDTLRVLAWQNTKDGQEGRNPPPPLARPGIEKPGAQLGTGEGMSVEDMDAWLTARNPAQHTAAQDT